MLVTTFLSILSITSVFSQSQKAYQVARFDIDDKNVYTTNNLKHQVFPCVLLNVSSLYF